MLRDISNESSISNVTNTVVIHIINNFLFTLIVENNEIELKYHNIIYIFSVFE